MIPGALRILLSLAQPFPFGFSERVSVDEPRHVQAARQERLQDVDRHGVPDGRAKLRGRDPFEVDCRQLDALQSRHFLEIEKSTCACLANMKNTNYYRNEIIVIKQKTKDRDPPL